MRISNADDDERDEEEEGCNRLFTYSNLTFILYYIVASSISVAILCDYAYSASVSGFEAAPMLLTCRNWFYKDWRTCGLNGVNCLPFENRSIAVRCPGRCDWPGTDGTYEFFGDNERGYHPLSRICPAAIHAGVLSGNGGCAVVKFNGSVSSFDSSKGHGSVSSQSISSPYYKSFVFETEGVDSKACYGNAQQYGVCMFVSAILLAGTTCFPRIFRPRTELLVLQAVVFGTYSLSISLSLTHAHTLSLSHTQTGTFYLAMTFYLAEYDNGYDAFTSALGCCTALFTLLFALWQYYEMGDGNSNPFRMMDEFENDRKDGNQIIHFNDDDDEVSSKVENLVEMSSSIGESMNSSISRSNMSTPRRIVKDTKECVQNPRHRRRFVYIFVFLPCFLGGLHFSLLSQIPGFDVDFSQNQGTESTNVTGRVVVLVLLSLLGLFLVIYYGRLAYLQGTLKFKMLSLLAVALVIVLTRFLFLESHNDVDVSFHLHHTTTGILVMTICKFRTLPSLILASIFLGVIVDGIVKWSEWDWFDTWMVSSTAKSFIDFGPDVGMLNWTSSSDLQLLVSNSSVQNSVNLTFPSADLIESLLGVQVQGTVILMNIVPSAELIYEHVRGTSAASCDETMCTITKSGLFPNTLYEFYYGCVLSNGVYEFNPSVSLWET